ncbi:uncharacterized protein LOC130770879 [Actinidia eriantha]|uniref:uncharacterized protein LOC130770879 n=1 Tax=Actinidia eriantha TaxID=165200 RepID=UPI0025888AE0|nr:uncharacterized protein LOC130770879 [Actinidia eriantha]
MAMESLLGFTGATTTSDVVGQSCGYKLVPWLSFDEWDSVRNSLFSSSPLSISSALQRITAWRSRGCLPVVIEVTASIVEIQQKDPYFRADLGGDGSDSEEMLSMLYCMAIMRLVNGVVEKTRKKTEVSIGEAADAINIPRMLIDIRHEGSHRDLPSLRLARLASVKALDWLKSYYWEPQKNAIPFQSDGTASLIKEIKSRLYELAFCLKIKQGTGSSPSIAKEKWIKHREHLCGHNKFLFHMAGKSQSSKSPGSKRHVIKALKHLVRLYCSYSSEVVSVLVELLLKGLYTSDLTELPKDHEVGHNAYNVQSLFDGWKPVIAKLSNKEPELLPTLIKVVLEMIETQEAVKRESGLHATEVHHIERLSDLFEWLVKNLKGGKPIRRKDAASVSEGSSTDIGLPKTTLVELLRRSLLVSCPGNNQLRNSAMVLAQMIANSSLLQKLNKLCSLWASDPTIDEENSSVISSEGILAQQEDSIHQAAKKLEFVKLRRMKSNVSKTTNGDMGNNNRWVVAKSWNSCPIGMLPCDIGPSGRLPVLDCDVDHQEILRPLQSTERMALDEGTRKRGPDCDTELLNNSHIKKARESEGTDAKDDDASTEGFKGRLMIGGVWKEIGEQELLSIASSVRILI